MLEGYYETIVKHIKTPAERLKDVLFILGGFAGAFVALFLGELLQFHALGGIGSIAAVVVGLYYAVSNTWEYEYIVTSGTVDIDKIIAKRKRVRLLSFDCKDCEIIAPMHIGNAFQRYAALPILDYTARTGNADNYFAVITLSGARTCVLFQPTEAMVQEFKQYNKNTVIAEK